MNIETVESINLEIAEVESVASSVSSIVSVNLSETLARGLEASYLKFARDIVERLASEHGFDADEALESLGIAESVAINIKNTSNNKPKTVRKVAKEPKEKVVKEVKEKVVKEKVAKKVVVPALKPAFPLPFCGTINDSCSGLCYADGLFLQCVNKKNAGDFCKRCAADAAKNEHEKPSHGIVQDRINQLQDFQAPNGKKQVPYYKIMKKLNLTQEQVEEEALRCGVVISPQHFAGEVVEPPKAKKARAVAASKKISTASVIEAQVDDIFAGLVAEVVAESAATSSAPSASASDVVGETKVDATATDNKPVKKVAAKVTKEVAVKVTKEVKEKVPKEVKEKVPKEVKEKVPKEVKEKVTKEVKEKVVKEVAAKVTKEVKEKVTAKPVKDSTSCLSVKPKEEIKITPLSLPDHDDELEEEEEEEVALEVKKMVIAGIEYLISTDNDAYHPITKEHIGLYIPDENRIEPVDDDDCDSDQE
jgi:hypothetical protein